MIKMNKKSMSVAECFDDFISYCKACNYFEFTVKFYKNTFHRFTLFYDISVDVCGISQKDVWEYINHIKKKGVSETTLHTYIRGLKTILRYFMREGYINEFHVSLPKKGETLKETYTEEEI